MEASELAEATEEARHTKREIGLTMGIFAVLLALATMLGHRMHTEEVVLQTRVNDQWAYYQAKNIRAHMYNADAELAKLSGANGAALAAQFAKHADDERHGLEDLRHKAEGIEEETRAMSRRASFYDFSEIFLEVAIVLCSISLLTDGLLFWRVSFASAAIGILIALWPLLRG
jgi:hypothetical protein